MFLTCELWRASSVRQLLLDRQCSDSASSLNSFSTGGNLLLAHLLASPQRPQQAACCVASALAIAQGVPPDGFNSLSKPVLQLRHLGVRHQQPCRDVINADHAL